MDISNLALNWGQISRILSLHVTPYPYIITDSPRAFKLESEIRFRISLIFAEKKAFNVSFLLKKKLKKMRIFDTLNRR